MEPDPNKLHPEKGETGYVPEIDLDQPPSPAASLPDSMINEPASGSISTDSDFQVPSNMSVLSGNDTEYSASEHDCTESDAPEIPDAEDVFSAPNLEPFSTIAATTEPVQMPPQNYNHKTHKTLFISLTAVFLTLAVAALGFFGYVYFVINPYAAYNKILPNVYCAGVNLGGMTVEEATAAIEDALRDTSYSVTLNLPDVSYDFTPTQEGVTLNAEAVAKRAYAYKRSDTSAYGMYKAYTAAKRTDYQLTAETMLKYSKEDIEAEAAAIFHDTYIAPTASSYTVDPVNHRATLVLGTPGRRVEPQDIADAVIAAFDSLDFSSINMEYTPVEIDMENVRTLCHTAADEAHVDPVESIVYANEETHAIDISIGTLGYTLNDDALYDLAETAVENGTYGEVTLDMEAQQPELFDITEAYQALACDPIEPYYYYGTVYEGQNGYTLDWEAAITDITSHVWGDTLSVAMTPIAPQKTAAEVEAVLFRDTLGSYKSPHVANANRTNNLTLACNAINGTVLNAGETFSFNSIVGERTAAKGYKSATVYVGGDSVEELGGGICQVASTIYDAVLYADLPVTNRAPHMYFVTYVPGGLDATVYWGSQDFCFKNDTEYPIRINASVSGGYVYISIDGTKTNNNYVKLSSSKLSTTNYGTKEEYSSSLPAGTRKETVSPYTGYVYEAYKYVYDGSGNLLETVYLGKSTYKKRDRVITIGTG